MDKWYDPEYHRQYQEARRIRFLDIARERLGGCCVRCGATENLEFDHIIPGSRVRAISSATNWSLKHFLTEVDKCQLLCSPCHRQKSREYGEQGGGQNRIDDPAHGTELCYVRGCRCKSCQYARYNARVRRGETTGTRGPYRKGQADA